MIQLVESFREKLGGGPVFGLFSKTSDPAFIECAGNAGFDFVIIDMEHGPNGVETVQNLVRAAQLTGVLPIVRVEEGNLSLVGKVLDVGAGGVQVPQVRGPADMASILEHARFAPEGMRGVCRFVRAAQYSATERSTYFRDANRAVIVVHLEGTEALENLEQILDAGGVDVVFIGPYDLSQSLGLTGQVDHPKVQAAMRDIVARCQARRVTIGTFADRLDEAVKWLDAGIGYLAYSVDVGIFYESCRSLLGRLKGPHR